MKTINYIKTTGANNIKSIKEFQKRLANMVLNTCNDVMQSIGFERDGYADNIWVDSYPFGDAMIAVNYKNDNNKVNIKSKVTWSDVNKGYRIEIVYNNANVFVGNVTLGEAFSIEEVDPDHTYNSQAEVAKEFNEAVCDWIKTL